MAITFLQSLFTDILRCAQARYAKFPSKLRNYLKLRAAQGSARKQNPCGYCFLAQKNGGRKFMQVPTNEISGKHPCWLSDHGP